MWNDPWKKIDHTSLFFTDKCSIDLSPFTKDSIRLEPETAKKLKAGDLSVYPLINREEKIFEKSLVIAVGISYYGVGKLIFLNRTMNEFAYAQTILFYKEDMNIF